MIRPRRATLVCVHIVMVDAPSRVFYAPRWYFCCRQIHVLDENTTSTVVVGMLTPLRDVKYGKSTGGRREEDTCNYGLS